MSMTDLAGFRGAIFDVDGVLVDSPHERAWREAFAELMDTEWRDVRELSSYAPAMHLSASPRRSTSRSCPASRG